MRFFLIVFHILVTLVLIGIILLQRGSDDDYGGSSMSNRGVKNGLTMMTSIMGSIFFINCLALAVIISREAKLHATKKEDIHSHVLKKTEPPKNTKNPENLQGQKKANIETSSNKKIQTVVAPNKEEKPQGAKPLTPKSVPSVAPVQKVLPKPPLPKPQGAPSVKKPAEDSDQEEE